MQLYFVLLKAVIISSRVFFFLSDWISSSTWGFGYWPSRDGLVDVTNALKSARGQEVADEVAQMSKMCENSESGKRWIIPRIRSQLLVVIIAFTAGIIFPLLRIGSLFRRLTHIWSFFSLLRVEKSDSSPTKARMRTLMRSTLSIFYENAAALLNFLNLGFSEPEAVQFNFSLLGFSSLPPCLSLFPLSVSLSKEEISLTLNSCVCHLLFHPLFWAASHCLPSSSPTIRCLPPPSLCVSRWV